MLDTQLVNDLFKMWQNLSEAGEIHIDERYIEKMKVLEKRVNKYNSLHNVSGRFITNDELRTRELFYFERGKNSKTFT